MELDGSAPCSGEPSLPVGITPGTEIIDEPFFYCPADSIKHGLAAISVIPNAFATVEIYTFFFFPGGCRNKRNKN